MVEHVLTWAALDEPRFELVEVTTHLGTFSARGTILAGGDDPYRVEYHLDTAAGFVTKRLLVTVTARSSIRSLRMSRDAGDTWTIRRGSGAADHSAPGEQASIADATDVDLRFSALPNTLPVLRHGLERRAGRVTGAVALVTVPQLKVVRAESAYTHRFRVPGGVLIEHRVGSASAEVCFGADGFVADYPGIARRIGPAAAIPRGLRIGGC